MDFSIVIPVTVFFMTLLMFFAISSYASHRGKQKEWKERLRGKGEHAETAWLPATAAPGRARLFKFLGAVGEAAKPDNVEEQSHRRRALLKAGYRRPDAPVIFFGARLCFAILLPLAFAALRTSVMAMLPYGRK